MTKNNQKENSRPKGAGIVVNPVTWHDDKVTMYQCIITVPLEKEKRLVTGDPCPTQDQALDAVARELYDRMTDTRTGLSAVRDYLNGDIREGSAHDDAAEGTDGDGKAGRKRSRKPRIELRPTAWNGDTPTEYKAFITVYRDATTERVYNGDASSTRAGAVIALKKELQTVGDVVCEAMKVLDGSNL